MPETTRVRRSKEERIAIIDKKIETHKANIEMLEAKKTIIMYPKTRRKKTTLKSIIAIAIEQGYVRRRNSKEIRY